MGKKKKFQYYPQVLAAEEKAAALAQAQVQAMSLRDPNNWRSFALDPAPIRPALQQNVQVAPSAPPPGPPPPLVLQPEIEYYTRKISQTRGKHAAIRTQKQDIEGNEYVKHTLDLKEVVVENLPMSADASDVLIAFREHLRQQQWHEDPRVAAAGLKDKDSCSVVVTCDLRDPAYSARCCDYGRKNAGHGFVVVRGKEAARYFAEATIRCRASTGEESVLRVCPSNRYHAALDRITSEALQLNAGSLQIVDRNNKVLWESGLGIKLVVQPSSRKLSIPFSTETLKGEPTLTTSSKRHSVLPAMWSGRNFTHMLEVYLIAIKPGVRLLHMDRKDPDLHEEERPIPVWALDLSFRSAPYLYRAIPLKTADSDDGVHKVRTVDASLHHAFAMPGFSLQVVNPAQCADYEAEEKLLALLRSYGIEQCVKRDAAWPEWTGRQSAWDDAMQACLRKRLAGLPALSFDLAFKLTMMVHEGQVSPWDIVKSSASSLVPCVIRAGPQAGPALDKMARLAPRKGGDPLEKHEDPLITNPGEMFQAALKILEPRDSGLSELLGDFDLPPLEDSADLDAVMGDGMMVRRVLVTPLSIVALAPENERSNRILRQYKAHEDRFLRVSFVDEGYGRLFANMASEDVCNRIRDLMKKGLKIAGRVYHFLAYSASQLRENSAWFYCEEPDRPGDPAPPALASIVAKMGDFKQIDVAGKHAARMGQCFSSTVSTVAIPAAERLKLPDIWDEGEQYCFSDGVGVMAPEVAQRVMALLPSRYTRDHVPSAFQIRWGGSKGMLSVWPNLLPPGCSIGTRPSMDKFPSDSHDLEVCEAARRLTFHLNRQVITTLTTLGVPEKVFDGMFQAAIDELDTVMADSESAQLALHRSGCNHVAPLQPLFFPSMQQAFAMLQAGFKPDREPHLRAMMHAFRARKLLDLQERARNPVEQAVLLLGILDETREMPADTVYFRCVDRETGVVTELPAGTKVAVGRCHCMHPGDIRVIKMADPELLPASIREMSDVLLFPQRGERALPTQMGGGDLDGDMFFVVWDPDLIPRDVDKPMCYVAHPPNRKAGGVKMEDVIDFFVDFITNNTLGEISNTHLAIADKSPDGVRDRRCVKLAELYSQAVDFPKVGVPVDREELRPFKKQLLYPDFMNKPDEMSYESDRVIGRIYRAAKDKVLANDQEALQERRQRHAVDSRLVILGHEEYLMEAKVLFREYKAAVLRLMHQYGVHKEGELMSAHVLEFLRARHNRDKDADVQERLSHAVAHLRAKFHALFMRSFPPLGATASDAQHSERRQKEARKASAWYVACYSADQSRRDDVLVLSFPWVAFEQLSGILGGRHEG